MNLLLANLVHLLHLLFIGFVVGVPLTNDQPLLLLHAVMVPFICAHWVMNDDACILTVLEQSYEAPAAMKASFTC